MTPYNYPLDLQFFAKIECNSVAMGRVSKVVRRFQLYFCVRHGEPLLNLFEIEQRYKYHSEKDGIFLLYVTITILYHSKNGIKSMHNSLF